MFSMKWLKFGMTAALFEEVKRKQVRSIVRSEFLSVEKRAVSEQLETAFKKLKEGRMELRNVIQKVCKMKNAGDDIANQVIAVVAQLFGDNYNPWLEQMRKLELWFPKLKY